MNQIITSLKQFKEKFETENQIQNVVLQNINFWNEAIDWAQYQFEQTIFLGCELRSKDIAILVQNGVFVYPKFNNLPYNPFRTKLYTWQELIKNIEEEVSKTIDYQIYSHFIKNKYNPPIHEALAQRIHDNSIDEALRKLLGYDSIGMTQKKAVGFMGGHSVARNDISYKKTAFTAKLLSEKGYYIVSGGGPGIMEAANLGAYFSGKSDDELLTAIDILSKSPAFTDEKYIDCALEVLKNFPEGTENLAIPTWFYGHEPTNLFASHIAKYFSNSIREDTLLSISLYGVVFAKGSAGTTQEIFQEAAQNHYGTFGYRSPMIFLGKERYTEETSIYYTLCQLAQNQEYKKLLFLTDSPELVVDFIENHPPIKV